MFSKATKKKAKLRLLLEGASGSGKTFSALTLASSLGKKIAVIDTEKGSASLYSNKFTFDVCELSPPYTPEAYIKAIKFAESSGFDVIVIDSMTHEWSGEGGCLDLQSKLGGRYQDWAKITPRHNHFVESILQSKCHIIATARAKSDYLLETTGGKNGKGKVTKVGTKTEQRDGLEFEFTTVFRLGQGHYYEVSKDRSDLFKDRQDIITKDTGAELLEWLNDGEMVVDPKVKHEESLRACKSVADLKGAWETIPAPMKRELNEIKEEVKAVISGPAIEPPTMPVTSEDYDGDVPQ